MTRCIEPRDGGRYKLKFLHSNFHMKARVKTAVLIC